MVDAFDSAWLKWTGAVVESHALVGDIDAFRSDEANLNLPILYRAEYHPQRHCVIYTVEEIGGLFPPFWGVRLGNIVQNFRSCLDHVAWALYKRGGTPNLAEQAESKVYFPITTSARHFKNVVGAKLPGVRRADIAVVRIFQPYQAGKRRFDAHPFHVLDELSRTDKHRTVQPVAPVPEATHFRIMETTDCLFRRIGRKTPRAVLEPGAELVRVYVKKTGPDPHVNVQPRFTIDPSINSRLTLEEFLNKTRLVTSELLCAFSDPPEFVKTITGRPAPRLKL